MLLFGLLYLLADMNGCVSHARMTRHMPYDEFGSPVDFREYSLLSNPSMPANYSSNVVHIRVCEVRSAELGRNKVQLVCENNA